jgi:hypothetical protein
MSSLHATPIDLIEVFHAKDRGLSTTPFDTGPPSVPRATLQKEADERRDDPPQRLLNKQTVDCLPVPCPALHITMPAPQVHQLVTSPIISFSFNADRSKLVLSPNSKDIDIYAKKGPSYIKSDSLVDHDKLVTGVDWAPKSNRIVTCSQDVLPLRNPLSEPLV